MITKENFRKVLEQLDFNAVNDSYFSKIYDEGTEKEFKIAVDFDFQNENGTKGCFEYPEGLTTDRNTTVDFHQNESFVVFECVIRLFDIGYKPQNILLEGLNYEGHSQGWIDILVRENDGTEYCIIECKTSEIGKMNDEFEKHWKKTEHDGDQLFRYFNTYSKAQYLCLYTCDLVDSKDENGKIKVLQDKYHLIMLKDNDEYLSSHENLKSYRELRENQGNKGEFFDVWATTYHKDFSKNGLIEKYCKPFDIGKKKTSVQDLKEIDFSSMQGKYNEYATILRKFNVSSKENAFDKLVNLFIAKIIDESENKDELKCLWRGAAYDDYFSLQDRLMTLYQKGMKKFFGDDVTYVENNEIDDAFFFVTKETKDKAKDLLKDVFRKLKYFNNNPFAILDVHNEKLFYQNAEILTEIVKSIQEIKIKTENQNQFLGDLFEGFLDQGIKQSEGQFFTPLPIVRFLISSLPVKYLIENSSEEPKVIDYACGAGHFLTEYAERTKSVLKELKRENEFEKYCENIFGIEKEYRLSKVSQVSAFMYGYDGIKIFYKDALSSNIEMSILDSKKITIKDGDFSVIVANPPYSVKGFLETLDEDEKKKFNLYSDDLNEDSFNSIETFFVERASQLLKNGGVCAIILPSSVLSNGNIYIKCREIILKYFDIVAIFESGSGTFGKTGTNTVTLFMRKKTHDYATQFLYLTDSWFSDSFDSDKFYNDSHFFEEYCEYNKIDSNEFKNFLCQKECENLLKSERFTEYRKEFENSSVAKKIKAKIESLEKKVLTPKYTQEMKESEIKNAKETFENSIRKMILNLEKEKLYYFMLAKSNSVNVLVVRSPSDSKAIKQFLGYEWSGAKGDEGIKYLGVNTSDENGDVQKNLGLSDIKTPLFNPQNFFDETKINSLIRNNFLSAISGSEHVLASIPDSLKSYASFVPLFDMLDFSRTTFDKAIKLKLGMRNEESGIKSKFQMVKLGENVEIVKGVNFDKDVQINTESKNIVLTADNISLEGKFDVVKKIYVSENVEFDDSKRLKKNDCFICFSSGSRLHVGKVAFITEDTEYFAGGFMGILRSKDYEKMNPKYLFEILNTNNVREIVRFSATGSNILNLSNSISEIKLPLPPKDIQQQIVSECEKIDAEYLEAQKTVEESKKQIEEIMENVEGEEKRIFDVCESINPSKSEISLLSEETIISFVEMASVSNDGFIESKIDKPLKDLKKGSYTYFAENDILIAKITPCMENGKCAIAEKLTNKIGFGSSEFHVFRCGNEILNKYLFALLNRESVRKNASLAMTGASGHRRVPISFYEDLKIPVPSISVQQEICSQINVIETKISDAKKTMNESAAKKEEVMRKWL